MNEFDYVKGKNYYQRDTIKLREQAAHITDKALQSRIFKDYKSIFLKNFEKKFTDISQKRKYNKRRKCST